MAASLNNTLCVRAVGSGDSQSFTMTRAGIVYDFLAIATSGVAGTVKLQNGSTDITAALNIGGADTTVVRAGAASTPTLDNGARVLAKGDVLSFTLSAGSSLAYEGYAFIFPTP